MGWDVCMARGHRGLLREPVTGVGVVTVHYALSPCLFSLGTFQSVQQQVDWCLYTLHGQAPCLWLLSCVWLKCIWRTQVCWGVDYAHLGQTLLRISSIKLMTPLDFVVSIGSPGRGSHNPRPYISQLDSIWTPVSLSTVHVSLGIPYLPLELDFVLLVSRSK